MRFIPFLRYPLESVLRNRRRSLFAIVGIVLALSLITGSSIAVDSSAYGVLRAAIGDVEVDIYVSDMSDDFITEGASHFDTCVEAIERVTNVEEAQPYALVSGWGMSSDTGVRSDQASLIFFDNDSQRMLDAYGIIGKMPSLGTVAISAKTAGDLAVEAGDEITLAISKDEALHDPENYSLVIMNRTWLNLTFEVSSIWTQDDAAWEDYYWGYLMGMGPDSVMIKYQVDPVVMNIEDIGSVMVALSEFDPGSRSMIPRYEYHVWIDRSEVIDLANVPATIEDLKSIQRRINAAGFGLGFYVSDNALISPLTSAGSELESMKLVFIVLSLPVVALGTYLSVVGVDLGLNERRREIGILKSRGASNRQVYWLMVLESVFLGAFAGLVGLCLGAVVSRSLLGTAVTLGSGLASSYELSDFRITSNTVGLALGFGVLLMLVSSYRPLKRLSKAAVSETLQHYSQASAQVGYKIKTDVILFSLSLLSIVSTLLGLEWISGQHGSWVLQVVLSIVIMVGIMMLPAMPFLLSLSVIRMVTRGSKGLYSKLTVLVRPWTKELHHLVDKNIVRNPRRASNLGVIISLALAFGLFISVTMESSIAYEAEVVKFDMGSDIRMDWRYAFEYGSVSDVDLSVLDEIRALDGVASSTTCIRCMLSSDSYFFDWWAPAALIEPEEYIETVDPSGFYFDGSRDDLLGLGTNGTVIVRSSWADRFSVVVGDLIFASYRVEAYSNGSYYTSAWQFPLTVIGTVRALPGLSDADVFIDRSTLGFIPDDNLTQGAGQSVSVFIELEGDPMTVSGAAAAKFADAGLTSPSVLVMEDRLEDLEDDPFFGPLADFLYMEYALAIITMSVGVGLIIFVSVSDRQVELACIMARGSSGSQMRRILMGESITLMVLGLLVGASVGLTTALIFNELSSLDVYTEVPRRMVFSVVSLVVVLVSVGSLLAASLVATSRAGRIRLAEVLRIRGG